MKISKRVRKVVFPVGGLGTRFLPATKALPKEMLPIANVPLIQYAFEEAKSAGIEQFIFITGRNKNAISNHFDYSYELNSILSENDKKLELSLARDWVPEAGKIVFIRQQAPRGLGHAVLCAKDVIGDEPFAVILADELLYAPPHGFLKSMCDMHSVNGGNMVSLFEVDASQTNKYGIASLQEQRDGLVKIADMVEKPAPQEAPSNLAIVGRYILQPEIFQHLENAKPGKGGEIQLTDAMKSMLKKREFYGALFKGQRFDCGNALGLLEANIAYSLANANSHDQVKNMLKKYGQKCCESQS